jgi:hypothetical protein
MDDEPTREYDPTEETVSDTPSDPPPEDVNQGATGERPYGETPLSVESESDPFAERPEAYVGAAFAGGLVLAMILRRFAR